MLIGLRGRERNGEKRVITRSVRKTKTAYGKADTKAASDNPAPISLTQQ
jgi:hypothetical protein